LLQVEHKLRTLELQMQSMEKMEEYFKQEINNCMEGSKHFQEEFTKTDSLFRKTTEELDHTTIELKHYRDTSENEISLLEQEQWEEKKSVEKFSSQNTRLMSDIKKIY